MTAQRLTNNSNVKSMKSRNGCSRQDGRGVYLLGLSSITLRQKGSGTAGSSKAYGTTNGYRWLESGGSMRNRSSSRVIRRRKSHLPYFPFPQTSQRSQDGQRAMRESEESQSGKLYANANVRLHVLFISSSIRYRRSGNEYKTNPPVGKILRWAFPTSIPRPTKLSRIPGSREGFGIENGVSCLECHGNMKSLLMRGVRPVLLLFQRMMGAHTMG